ncbi:MAG: hypothetical protein AB7N76_07660 [Planctomycetota bacterium]
MEHAPLLASLGEAERTLLLLRDELYGGSWDELVADLEARQHRKPYVFKLSSRIEADLELIARLRAQEQEHGVDLGALLEAQDKSEGEEAP